MTTKHGFTVGDITSGKPCTPMFGREVRIIGFEGYGLVDVSFDGIRGLVGANALQMVV